jgi:hypothetical protein
MLKEVLIARCGVAFKREILFDLLTQESVLLGNPRIREVVDQHERQDAVSKKDKMP